MICRGKGSLSVLKAQRYLSAAITFPMILLVMTSATLLFHDCHILPLLFLPVVSTGKSANEYNSF